MKPFVKRLLSDKAAADRAIRCRGSKAGREFAEKESGWHVLEQLAAACPPDHERLWVNPGLLQSVFERVADPTGLYMTPVMWRNFWTTWAGAPIVPDCFVAAFWAGAVEVFNQARREIDKRS